MRCPSCGAANGDRARFCSSCGIQLGPAIAPAQLTRRTVTVLFADVVGSTHLGERLDPEIVRSVQQRFFDALRTTIEEYGGRVEKYVGDAVMGVFGWPRVHEDDAIRAVRAAFSLAGSLGPLNDDLAARGIDPIVLRVGIATGPVVRGSDPNGALVTGDTVNVAARLQQFAEPGAIVASGPTRELTRTLAEATPRGGVELRGRSDAVEAFVLESLIERHEGRRETPLVGRLAVIETLLAIFDGAVETRTPVLAVVVGPAGAGKSRLLREVVERMRERATVLTGRCVAYGNGITYWPIVEVLRDVSGVAADATAEVAFAAVIRRLGGDVPPRLGTVVGAVLGAREDAVDSDDIAWAFRRLCELIAAERPLVLVVEDAHWADPAVLSLIETTLEWVTDLPLVLLATARTELLEEHPEWAIPGRRTRRITLDPLAAHDLELLLDAIPGGSALGQGVRRRLVDVADGNPLYLEELVGMLVDQGRLRRDADTWSADVGLDTLRLPATISALLAARLDALESGEQRAAERGSVVGRTFERGAVAAMSGKPERPGLAASLLGLLRRDLIAPAGRGIDGDDAFRFRHVLIRDAAYDRLPKADRAALHEAYVEWLDGLHDSAADAYVEIAAHHLAQAAEFRLDLEPGTEGTSILARRAIDRLWLAAEHSRRLQAFAEQTRHLRRRTGLVDAVEGADARVEARRRLAEAMYLAGDPDVAIEVVRDAISLLPHRGGRREASLLGPLATYAEAYGDRRMALEAADRGLVIASDAMADEVYLELLNAKARILMLSNEFDLARGPSEEAVGLARSAGNDVQLAHALSTLAITLLYSGDREAALALAAESRSVGERTDDPSARMRTVLNLSVIVDGGERREDLRALCRAILEEVERQGVSRMGVAAGINMAAVELWSGAPTRSEATARRVIDEAVPSEMTAFAWHLISASRGARGLFDGAAAAGATARETLDRLGVPGGGIDYEINEAEIALWRGRPAEALETIERALHREQKSDPDKLVRILVLAVRAAVDAALAARGHDVERELTNVERARTFETRLAAFEASGALGWQGRSALAQVDGELSRLGPPRPEVWADAIARLRDANVPPLEAYAAWRWVEALGAAGADRGELEAGRQMALDLARRVEAGHLVARLKRSSRVGAMSPTTRCS
jgi:class 3 adenylate cyclase/tetratricopeptide (TPR) repeat protein